MDENYVSAEFWALKAELLFPIQQNLVAQALQEHDAQDLHALSRDTNEPLSVLPLWGIRVAGGLSHCSSFR